MSSELPSRDLDREVDQSMRMFEKSKVGPAAAITPATPQRVLLALDGSPQDDTAAEAARYLQARFGNQTLVLDARDGSSDEQQDLAGQIAESIDGSVALPRGEGDSYDRILAAVGQHESDLLIVPCPFGREFEQVGADSAGTVIDVMLARCPVAMLVIRRGDQLLSDATGNLSMIVGAECDVETRAAAWIFGLAAPNASVALNLVIEKEQFQNIRSIVEALSPETQLQPEQFGDALTKTHHAIHSAMAKTAAEMDIHYSLRPQAGEVAPPNPLEDSSKMMLVLPLEVDDRFGQGFVQDRIRRSPHPVLVVPGHVKPQ